MQESTIRKIAIIGLGAVGVNFAYAIQKHLSNAQLYIVADRNRISRYQREGVYYNEERCNFTYVADDEITSSADLVLFCVKFYALTEAMASMKHQIDDHTLVMSAVNGITSEEILSAHFPDATVIPAVAQGMDATKEGNRVYCQHIGELCFGAGNPAQQDVVAQIHRFFTSIHFPHTIKDDIIKHQWGKFMLNCGLNQVTAVHHGTYATIQNAGKPRDKMLKAMKEVQQLALCEGIHLSDEDVIQWAAMCDPLNPEGMPSMAQDVKAQRKTEADLFGGEVCRRAMRYGLSCPINTELYHQLTAMETTAELMDEFSYQLGVMDAFCEMVHAHVKPLALSHPFHSEAEMKRYQPYAEKLAVQYGIGCFAESQSFITDLFPTALNQGKCNLIFYRDLCVYRKYFALKKQKEDLLRKDRYQGEARKQLACAYGALLGYDMTACEAKLSANHDKE